FTRSGGLKQKIAEVVTEENYTMKITCNSFSPSNLANALGSSIEVVSFSENEILPSGEISDGEYKYVRIKAGTNPLLKAKLIFVGSPVAGKRVIAIIHEANIKMGGDLPLMSEDFASMSFEGSANKTEEGYYTHFIEQEAKRFLPTELSASVKNLSLLLSKKETIAINTNASDYSYEIESETQDFITLKKMDTNLEVTSKKVGSGIIKIKAKGKDMKESELSIEVVVQEMPITELDASNKSVSLIEGASESIDISTNATSFRAEVTLGAEKIKLSQSERGISIEAKAQGSAKVRVSAKGEDMRENSLEIDCAITEKPTTELSTTPESLNITLSQTETLQVNTNATDFTYELQELSEADCITILKQDSNLQVSGAKVGTGKIVLKATKEGMKEAIKEVQVAVNNT
ncbi:hypothetical protein, partial [Helicobacter bilis]|uniref:hypothetical protein n=1 Tax=Helicobacter bilis TaxID=37372 RepID=UPI00248E172C